MTREQRFCKYIDSQGLRYFTGKEMLPYFKRKKYNKQGKCIAENSLPPTAMWKCIVDALVVVDQLRHVIGKPITISSSYRNEAYNRACGGVKYSQHKVFRALDIQCSRSRPKTVFKALQKLRSEGKFKGGLGLYRTFVHIDTRGRNATWGTNLL